MNKQPKIMVYSTSDVEVYADLIREAGYTNVVAAATPAEAEAELTDTEIILCWKFPLDLLARPEAASVKWIQSMGAGVDDLVRCEHISDEIILSRVVDQYSGPMAEYVFAYLLYIAQNIARTRAAQSENRWDPFLTDVLAKKTIGVAGLGSIGSEIIRKARAFDMNVHGLSYSGKRADLVDRHYGPDEWLAFVKELDILVMILPLTEQTHQVVNREILMAMKPTACLVNVGRGLSIVERDLLDVMRAGHLRAAILDVFEKEPLASESPLWQLPNVYVTPHLSGMNTDERVGQYFLENVKRYLANEPLHGLVNRSAQY